MIEKIEITNTATYDNEILDDISKINFVYGNNGCGKTTISRIINNEDAYQNCKVHWTDNRKIETLVYNSDFIEENFNSSNAIKGIFTLGKEESDTQKKIAEETEAIDALNTEISEVTEKLTVNNDSIKKQTSASKNKFWKIKQKFDKEKSPLTNAITGARGKVDTFFDKVIKENKTNKAALKTKTELEEIARQCYIASDEPITLISNISYTEIENLESNEILKKPIVGKEDLDIATLIKTLQNPDWVKSGIYSFIK